MIILENVLCYLVGHMILEDCCTAGWSGGGRSFRIYPIGKVNYSTTAISSSSNKFREYRMNYFITQTTLSFSFFLLT